MLIFNPAVRSPGSERGSCAVRACRLSVGSSSHCLAESRSCWLFWYRCAENSSLACDWSTHGKVPALGCAGWARSLGLRIDLSRVRENQQAIKKRKHG